MPPATSWIPASNSNQTFVPAGREIRGIVLHDTEGPLTAAISWFKNPVSGVSAHYLIGKSGQIVQMVRDQNIAYHAKGDADLFPDWLTYGPNQFYTSRVNAFTLGIELELLKDDADGDYPMALYEALAWLLDKKLMAHDIPGSRIISHASIQKDRTDPRGLNWTRLFL